MGGRVTYLPSLPYLSSTLVAPSITEPSIFEIGPQSLSIAREVIPSNTCSLAAHVYHSLSLTEVSCLSKIAVSKQCAFIPLNLVSFILLEMDMDI